MLSRVAQLISAAALVCQWQWCGWSGSGSGQSVPCLPLVLRAHCDEQVAANPEVWSASSDIVEQYRAYEQTLRDRTRAIGADLTICRAGTLKGGGPGPTDSPDVPPNTKFGLSQGFYDLGQQDLVNWRLLFDSRYHGVEVTPGDVMQGPGLGAVFCATSAQVCSGDSSRVAVAACMAAALCHPEDGNLEFGVSTKEVPSLDEGIRQVGAQHIAEQLCRLSFAGKAVAA